MKLPGRRVWLDPDVDQVGNGLAWYSTRGNEHERPSRFVTDAELLEWAKELTLDAYTTGIRASGELMSVEMARQFKDWWAAKQKELEGKGDD